MTLKKLLLLCIFCCHNHFMFASSFKNSLWLHTLPKRTQLSAQIPPQPPVEDYANRPGPWDDRTLNTLLDANKAWAKRMVIEKPDFFKELKKGHAPKILWIGCSDARVPANEIIGEPPGSVFIHRNIANMVVNTDFNCMSVIQYAVDILKVKHIVVCGHYDCGGVKAALEAWDHKSPLENWLRNIRDTYRLHMDEINLIPDLRDRQRRLVELNVIEQCVNIFKTSVVQRRRVETHNQIGIEGSKFKFSEPRVHALVYEPTTGEARKLPVNFNDYLKELRNVYELYAPAETPFSAFGPDVGSEAALLAANANASAAKGVKPVLKSVPLQKGDFSTGSGSNDDLDDEEELALQSLLDQYPKHVALDTGPQSDLKEKK